MSSLFVYPVSSPDLPNKVLTHVDDMASTLAELGVRFERFCVATAVRPGTAEEDVLDAARAQLDQLMTRHGCVAVEVISLDNNHPQKAERCAALLREQRQDAEQVWCFLGGRGQLSLHLGGNLARLLPIA